MKTFTTGLALLGTMAFLVAVALTVIDIVLRTFSGLTVHGLTDIVTLCTMFGALLSIPYGFAHGEHVAIDVFTSRLPAAGQRACGLLGAGLAAVFLGATAWFATRQMLTEWGYGDRSQSIGIPLVYYWLPLVAGIAIAAVTCVWVAWRIVAGRAQT